MIIQNCLYFGVHPETAFKILDKGMLWNFALLKADTRFNLYFFGPDGERVQMLRTCSLLTSLEWIHWPVDFAMLPSL